MRLLIENLGGVVTGKSGRGLLEAGSILAEDGFITKIGIALPEDRECADTIVNAQGVYAAPGLIDTHVHVVLGDFTPRQNTLGFIESYMHGGVTSMVSAGEVHAPGCPKDREGVKALAVLAQRSFANLRPGGVKVQGGTVILQPVLEDEDFEYLYENGIRLAKMGFGDFAKPVDALPQIRAAQKHGIMVMTHTGGASIPGSSPVTGADLIAMQPDIAGHVNGGTTALSDEETQAVIRETDIALQIVQAGNLKSSLHIVGVAQDEDQLERVMIASDTPSGTGVMPLALLKTMAEIASLSGIRPEDAIAMATGNPANIFGYNRGVLETGREADIILIDAPSGSQADSALAALAIGDLPGIGAVIIDGTVRAEKSRNTPLAKRLPVITHR